MQYNLSKLTPIQIAALDKLPVRNQDAITAKFGEPFIPSKAFYLLRDATNNFTKSAAGDVAYQLDAKLYEWSQKAGQKQPEPVAPTNDLSQAIDALRTALEFTDDQPTQKKLSDAIQALEVALEFA